MEKSKTEHEARGTRRRGFQRLGQEGRRRLAQVAELRIAQARNEVNEPNCQASRRPTNTPHGVVGKREPFAVLPIVQLHCLRIAMSLFDIMGQRMKLIEPDEVEDFRTILRNKHIDIDDFGLFEIDTTDPKTDEIFALQGRLSVIRKSNGLWKQYPIGDGMEWLRHFQKDLNEGAFG